MTDILITILMVAGTVALASVVIVTLLSGASVVASFFGGAVTWVAQLFPALVCMIGVAFAASYAVGGKE